MINSKATKNRKFSRMSPENGLSSEAWDFSSGFQFFCFSVSVASKHQGLSHKYVTSNLKENI